MQFTTSWSSKKQQIIWWALVGMVFVIALFLRAEHLDFGLPQRLHPDENTQVENALEVARGTLNPNFFRYPSGLIYLLALLYKGYAAIKPVLGLPELYLASRWVSVVFSSATVLVTIYWGREIWGPWIGLFAGFLFAILYTSIEHAHYATVDTPLTLGVTLTLFFISTAILKSSPKRYFRLAALSAGIASSIKYNAILLIIPLMIAAWSTLPVSEKSTSRQKNIASLIIIACGLVCLSGALVLVIGRSAILSWATSLTSDGLIESQYLQLYEQFVLLFGLGGAISLVALVLLQKYPEHQFWRRTFNPELLLLLAIVILTFSVLSPYVLFEWRAALRDFLYEYRHMRIGSAAHYAEGSTVYQTIQSGNQGAFPNWKPYFELLNHDFGLLGLGVMALGWLALGKRNRIIFAAYAIFGVLLLTSIISWINFANRYILPIYPLLAIISAGGFYWFFNFVSQKTNSLLYPAITSILLAGLLLVQPTISVIEGRTFFQLPDTRELALEWALDQIEPGALVIEDDFTPDFELISTDFEVHKVGFYFLDHFGVDAFRQNMYRYVFTSFNPEQPGPNGETALARYPEFVQFYKLVQTFAPDGLNSKGRAIYIYKHKE